MKKPVAMFKPLNKTKLHQEIVEQLKNRIINREVAPGDKLPAERALAEMFQVNRSTVRQALGKLESMALVEIRHGEGVFVKDYLESGSLELVQELLFKKGALDMAVFKNLMDLRQLLVPEMAWCAAKNRTDAEMEKIERIIASTNEQTMAAADMQLHHVIARASGNVLYVLMLNAFTTQMNAYYQLYFSDPDNIAETRRFHTDIAEAIRHRQPDRAKQIMQTVLASAAGKSVKMLAA